MKRIIPTLLSCTLTFAAALYADVTPHALFCNHAVLQRDKPIPVWGQAAPGEKVTVRLADKIAETTVAGADGRWSVRLPAQPVGGPFTLVFEGKNRVEVTDVWLGDVWVCSGQSNMERQLGLRSGQKPIENWEQAVATADYPKIRYFAEPGKWEVCSPQTAPHFTAVGYFFGRELHRQLQVPIGLINRSRGGTPAEKWIRQARLASDFPEILAAHEKKIADYPAVLDKYQAEEPALLKAWEEASAAAAAAGKPAPRKPKPPNDPRATNDQPSVYYQGLIAPLQPYAICGVIWYQGEANAHGAETYRSLFPALIADWRAQWGQGDFPFLFVQIAPYKSTPLEIRDAQLHAWRVTPNTAMVVTTDVGDADDIHPTRKEPVGARLALAARALAYGEKIEYSGPRFISATAAGGKMIVRFDHLGGGLVAKDGPLRGFTISGDGKTFVPAEAAIVGDTVEVRAANVAAPLAVRYGWANVPDVNLYNAAGLPASPFRSDGKP
ncbi:MAG: sialate O-acetylesterase [bacterium]